MAGSGGAPSTEPLVDQPTSGVSHAAVATLGVLHEAAGVSPEVAAATIESPQATAIDDACLAEAVPVVESQAATFGFVQEFPSKPTEEPPVFMTEGLNVVANLIPSTQAGSDVQEQDVVPICVSPGPKLAGPPAGPSPMDPGLSLLVKTFDAMGLDEATDSPASPRSPLHFPMVEATALPASPRNPTPVAMAEMTTPPPPPHQATSLRFYYRRRARLVDRHLRRLENSPQARCRRWQP
jgi:hypothetical protein